MKKVYFLLICFAASHLTLLAQSSAQIKIDSLRKVLPSLKDSARVDCLISLAEEHWSLNQDKKRDSSYRYMELANQEALKIGYQYGQAMSLLQKVVYEKLIKQNLTTAKAYVDKAILIGKKIKNDKVLGKAYLTYALYIIPFSENRDVTIEYYKKAQGYFQKAGDKSGELEVNAWLCEMYVDSKKYEEGFDYCAKCIELSKIINSKSTTNEQQMVWFSLVFMGELYEAAGDYQTAIEYFKKCDVSLGISNAFRQMKQYDSALYYWNQWKKNSKFPVLRNQAHSNVILGQIYLETGRNDEALKVFEESILGYKKWENEYGKINRTAFILPTILIAKAYANKKNWNAALKYATESLDFAQREKIHLSVIEVHELLSKIYHALGKDSQAYANLRQYMVLRDSVVNRQFLWRLGSYKKEAEAKKKKAEIELLNKDNQIKDEQLKQENLIKKFLIAGLVGLMLISIFIFRTFSLKQKNESLKRSRLENELKVELLESQKHEAELRQQASELEMQALRAQMNPHFIFNCLSSINRFILKNEPETASDYLTRFSRLIRLVLSNSKRPLVFLEDELEMLRLYIEMERLRFKNSFDFNISFKNEVDTSAIPIPPLLLQPFIENAIWHGLMNKDGHGQVDIAFSYEDSRLTCSITDNGVGRKKAEELKSKKEVKGKSMGLQITAERLAKLNRENNQDTFFSVKDLFDREGHAAGTEVVLHIRMTESMREVGSIANALQ